MSISSTRRGGSCGGATTARGPAAVLPTSLPHPAADAAAPRALPRMCGLCWEATGEIGPRQLDAAVETGANWISQTPFGWVRSEDQPEIVLATDRALWGESDS